MRRFRLLARRASLAAFAAVLLSSSSAEAAGVAYLDGKEVWVASLDGAEKVRLSAGEGDWTAVAQSDQGYVVGVRLEAGKIAALSSFTIWNPDGTQKDFGPLAGKSNGGSDAYPLSLDLTPAGGLLVYGYSNYVYGFPVGTLTSGHFLLPSGTRAAPVGGPYSNSAALWPTLVGERIIGTPDRHVIAVQEAGSTGSTNFVGWIDTTGTGGELHRSDASSDGRVVASEISFDDGDPTDKIGVFPTDGLGLALRSGDCWLPAQGAARDASVSNDGTLIAWGDTGGVKVGGVPDFSGAEPCNLTKAPTVISPTGKWPSLGPIDVAAIAASRRPSPSPLPGAAGPTGASGGTDAPAPVIAPTASLKTAALGGKSGASVQVFSQAGGKATVTLTVLPKALGKKGKKPIVIATGSATLPAGSATTARTIKLKATKSGRKSLRRLKKKKATLTLVIGGQTITAEVKLK